jgi:diguanylate cyclase (GGDEF)-like protein
MTGIDHSESINERCGHGAGVDVLAEMGGRLRAAVRARDVIGLYGGQEVATVFPGVGHPVADLVQRLRASVARTPVRRGAARCR